MARDYGEVNRAAGTSPSYWGEYFYRRCAQVIPQICG